MRLLHTLKYDVIAQFRYGFYYAYMVVIALYVVLLRSLPMEYRDTVEVLIIFTDPSAIGFFIIGGVLLMEKDQNTLENLFVTPLRIYEYIFSKVLSLTIMALIASAILLALTWRGPIHIVPMFFGIVLTSVFFTLLGFIAAVRSETLNQYLLKSPLYVIVFYLPVLGYLDVADLWIYNLIPGKASLLLLEGASSGISPSLFLGSVALLCAWIFIAYYIAKKSFERRIILRIGDGKL